MQESILYIKNMVCPRCIASVKNALTDLDIPFHDVELGQVKLTGKISDDKRKEFAERIRQEGFELLEQGRSSLIARIKSRIIQQIHHADKPLTVNFSVFIADQMNHDYSYLSRLFSSVEGITIERYIAKQRIEKVKELLFYDEKSLAEIADLVGFSSVAYLSAQFKKETGMTISAYRKEHQPHRKHLDTL